MKVKIKNIWEEVWFKIGEFAFEHPVLYYLICYSTGYALGFLVIAEILIRVFHLERPKYCIFPKLLKKFCQSKKESG